MVFISIVTLFIGGMSLWMGAAVVFWGKVGLINNFYADQKAGKLTESYARRVGWIWLGGGAALTAVALRALFTNGGKFMALLQPLCVLAYLALCRVHYQLSVKR